jgi:hypothetical protein
VGNNLWCTWRVAARPGGAMVYCCVKQVRNCTILQLKKCAVADLTAASAQSGAYIDIYVVPYGRSAGAKVGMSGVTRRAFVAGWTMILGGGALCTLCLALSLLDGAVREVCDDQQSAAIVLCVSQCGTCPPGIGATTNCSRGDICDLEAAFVLVEGCLFHDVPAKDVLEGACMGV